MSQIRVAFLGPAGSFSHEAALQLYGPSAAEFVPCVSFAVAFSAVQRKTAHCAVIPFENSTNGSVVQTLDLLADHGNLYSDIVVHDEHYLAVHHCLLAHKNAAVQQGPDSSYRSITKLYTHPQAWGQCEQFLSRYFKGVERQDVSSTSKAAEIVSRDATGQSAAIASRFAADHYGTSILEANIEDKHENTTRFLVLRNLRTDGAAGLPETDNNTMASHIEISPPSQKQKALISFTINHSSPGALADALLTFKTHGMNLTSINSRPSLVRAWQYIFFVECEAISLAHFDDVAEKMLQGLRNVTESCRNLGNWRDRLLAG